MIICSCNVISDHDVRNAVSGADDVLRHAKHVYESLGCSMECGRCARTIRTVIGEELGACAQACRPGCRHSRPAADTSVQDEFALAAS